MNNKQMPQDRHLGSISNGMKTFTLSFLIAVLVFIAVPSAYAATPTQLEKTIELMQKTQPLPPDIQNAVENFVKKTCDFGYSNGLIAINSNLKNDFATWPSYIKIRLQKCAYDNTDVVTDIQNKLLALSQQNKTPSTPSTATAQTQTPTPEVTSGTVQRPPVSSGSGFVPLAPIPGLTEGATANTEGLANFFNNLYKFAIGIAAVLAVIMIIWGGLEYSTQDSISKKSDAKERIHNAIFGLILVLSPVLVFSIINPSILNLSINLKPIDTKSGGSTGTGGGTGGGTGDGTGGGTGSRTVDPQTKCSVTGTAGILQIVTCPSPSAAASQNETTSCGSSGGQISIISQNTLTDGTVVSSVLMCEWPNKYVFIDTSTSGFWGYITSKTFNVINNFQPLAIAGSNSSNGSSATQFASTCSTAGLTMCISDPTFTFFDNCIPTPKTALPGSPRKCGELTLTCRNYVAGWAFIASLCSNSPRFNPFP